jgi:hypothetical protein
LRVQGLGLSHSQSEGAHLGGCACSRALALGVLAAKSDGWINLLQVGIGVGGITHRTYRLDRLSGRECVWEVLGWLPVAASS